MYDKDTHIIILYKFSVYTNNIQASLSQIRYQFKLYISIIRQVTYIYYTFYIISIGYI